MRQMDTLQEMAKWLPPGIVRSMGTIVSDMADFLDGVPAEEASFAVLFGAPAFLVEAVEDLGQVLSFDEGLQGRLSLLEAASPSFDVAEWLEAGAFARFVTIETTNGGPQYFVPAAIAQHVPSVAESIRLKAEMENGS